jgi:glycosyltransferase involved in cell wall biosynthesis
MVEEAIRSAEMQEYPLTEILVNERQGIGTNLQECMEKAKGKYVVYLCSDDVFTNPKVLGDIVSIFDKNPDIGVIGRYFYFFMDGYPGAIGTCRDKNILTQSCCPSGMAFRKREILGTNKIFVEMPFIVSQYLPQYRWTMIEYDTIAARFHPGGNTGTKKSYYTESPTQNWYDLVGTDFEDFPMFVQLKNRASIRMVWREICLVIRNDWRCLLKCSFHFYAWTALLVDGFILRNITIFYRHRIARKFAHIIERGNND